jgi:hypothetical protein
VSARRFVTVDVMHGAAMKFGSVLRRVLSARGHRTVVPLAIVEVVVYVSIEMLRPVKPWSRADENTSGKPLGPIITVWSAVIRRSFIIAVRTNGRFADADCDLLRSGITGCSKKCAGRYQENHQSEYVHLFTLPIGVVVLGCRFEKPAKES